MCTNNKIKNCLHQFLLLSDISLCTESRISQCFDTRWNCTYKCYQYVPTLLKLHLMVLLGTISVPCHSSFLRCWQASKFLIIRPVFLKSYSSESFRRMLDLFVYWTELDKLHKFVHIRKSILNAIKHLVGNESGRKALIKCDGIAILYSTAKQVNN